MNRARRLCMAAAASAAVPQVMRAESRGELPGWQMRGRGTMRVLGLTVYDAALWVAPGFEPAEWANHGLMLRLDYHRKLEGRAIAERSLQEMRRGGPIDDVDARRWQAWMESAFGDVQPGDHLAGRWWPDRQTTGIRRNGSAWQELGDPAFGRRFFGIWLAPHSSAPALRSRLLALS